MTQSIDEGETRGAEHLTLAGEYAQAAHRLRLAGVTSRPFWMLVGHALELSLKAFLLKAGVDEERLMVSVNHSLWSAMTLARRRGFEEEGPLGEDLVALIEALEGPHSMQTFRYPSLPERPIPIDPQLADAMLAGHLRRIADRMGSGHTQV